MTMHLLAALPSSIGDLVWEVVLILVSLVLALLGAAGTFLLRALRAESSSFTQHVFPAFATEVRAGLSTLGAGFHELREQVVKLGERVAVHGVRIDDLQERVREVDARNERRGHGDR